MAEVRFTGFVEGYNPQTGRGKNPERKHLNDSPVLNFTVHEPNNVRDQNGEWKNQGTTFWRCQAWGPLAETWANLTPGSRIEVIGTYKTRSYEKQDGTTGYASEVKADFIRAVPTKNQTQQQGQAEQPYQNGYAARAGIPQQGGYGAPPQGNQPPQADPWANQPAAQGWGTTQPPADPEPPF